MSEVDAALASSARVPAMLAWLWSLRPPVSEPRFWVVQAGVLGLAALHDVVLDDLSSQSFAAVPAPTSSGLLLIPVIYAALNFGVRGAVGTALWSTALLIPNWFVAPEGTAVHLWIEAGYLLILNVVAVVVGQRVEREQRARHKAEAALQAAKDAQSRYHSLFEDQPAPVIVTDADGVIGEANTAARRHFGTGTVGRRVEDLLGVATTELLDGTSRCLALPGPDGSPTQLVPTAHRLTTTTGAAQVQVVLTDVTDQHRREEEERLFAGRLLTVQEEERRRLARELHDDPLQSLAYLSRALGDLSQRHDVSQEYTEPLTDAAGVATDAATALRKIIHGLRPPVLDDLGLVSALRQLALDTQRRTGLCVQLRVRGQQSALPPELALAAYRIAQEALTNVVRHAHATHASLSLTFNERLALTIADDGRGMLPHPERRKQTTGGLGLIGMRERVNMAGGELTVAPQAPHGTRIRAVLPFDDHHTP